MDGGCASWSHAMLELDFKQNKVKSKFISQLEQISVVFHQYETGVRSGTIRPGVGMKTFNLCGKSQNNRKHFLEQK